MPAESSELKVPAELFDKVLFDKVPAELFELLAVLGEPVAAPSAASPVRT